MCDKWLNGSPSTESGILRKPTTTHHPVNVDELLVFGYACKLFRDDDKAKYIDQGKHLIPWMGDDSLKIDRYDVRATLSDLSQYETPFGGYTNRLDYLTTAEQRAEQLCEEERYLSLNASNDFKEDIHEDTEPQKKSLNPTPYSQVNYNYDAETGQTEHVDDQHLSTQQGANEPFIPHANFVIPDDIERPLTAKQNIFIEKTAKFIAEQGTQMEILIKTKQSNNSQFEFLNQNDTLNKYYKYILNAMKAGIYPLDYGQITDSSAQESSCTNVDVVNVNGTSAVVQMDHIIFPKPPVPTLKYKPSPDCTYTQLISKIKGVPLPPIANSPPSAEQNPTSADIYSDQFYQNYSDYSGYYNASHENSTTVVIENPTNSLSTQQIANALTGTVKNLPVENQNNRNVENVKSNNQISSGLLLAQCYHSDTESDEEKVTNVNVVSENTDNKNMLRLYPDIEIPPPELQNIIDKTAAYVLKNGKEFEDILRVKNDPRFSFLMPSDKYNRYYNHKVTQAIYPFATSADSVNPYLSNHSINNDAINLSINTTKSLSDTIEMQPKTITGVSFSIKSKDEQPIQLKQVLLQEPSSDEDEAKILKNAEPPSFVLPQNKQLSGANHIEQSHQQNQQQKQQHLLHCLSSDITSDENILTVKLNKKDLDMFDASIRDAMLESTSNDDEKRAAKRAEDKFKDRMAQIARGKLGSLTREKQLQLERRKKAIAFMNQIKSGTIQEAMIANVNKSKIISHSNMISTHSTTKTPVSDLPETNFVVLPSPSLSPLPIDVSDTECSIASTHSSPILVSVTNKSNSDNDIKINYNRLDDKTQEEIDTLSRSLSRSRSVSSKKKKSKKSKHRYSKKNSKKSSRPRPTSRRRSKEWKHKKHRSSSSSHKAKRKRKNSHDS